MADQTARDMIGAMTLRQLETMPRDDVAALPDDARALRRERLAGDTTPRGIPWIVATFGTKSRSGPTKWRGEYLANGGRETENALPAPLNEDECKQPGELGPAGASPVWPAGQLRVWGHRYDRLDEDYYPTGGRKSTGRPPKNRDGLVTVTPAAA